MKITLFSGETELEYDLCEIESSFVELTFVGQACVLGGGLRPPVRIVTTLGYIIETEVDDKPPVTFIDAHKTTFGSLLPNERESQ